MSIIIIKFVNIALIFKNVSYLQNGLLSSLPYLGKYIFALSMSTLADYLLRINRLSVTAIRKIFTTFGE